MENQHTQQHQKLIEQIRTHAPFLQQITSELQKIIVGNEEIMELLVIALLCDGHVLLEGLPGVAKTTMIKALAGTLGISCKRIQFTPDLLPSDLIGTLVYNQKTTDFETKFGPIFTHVIVADEINRAPAKVQSALLEAMQEQQVTIGTTTYQLEKPFLVFATQNPLEQDGTYPLPEAQIDRFLFKLIVAYPTYAQERELIFKPRTTESVQQVLSREQLLEIQSLIHEVYVDNRIIDYILQLIFTLREPRKYQFEKHANHISYAPSPRATLALFSAAQARAFVHKRHFVTPDDVRAVAPAVLRHRVMLNFEAEAEKISPDMVIQALLKHVKTP